MRSRRVLLITILGVGWTGVAAILVGEWYLTRFATPQLAWPPGGGAAELAYDLRHTASFFLTLLYLVLAVLVGLGAMGLTLLRTARRRPWQRAALALVGCAVALIAADYIAHEIRRAAFRSAAEAMTPLVQAVERFRAVEGRLPRRLDDLDGRYVPSGSRFGVRGCRSDPELTGRGSDWELVYECPNGMMNLDRLFYRSDGDPAPYRVERVGTWFYVWD